MRCGINWDNGVLPTSSRESQDENCIELEFGLNGWNEFDPHNLSLPHSYFNMTMPECIKL